MRKYVPSAKVKTIIQFDKNFWETQKPIKDQSFLEALDISPRRLEAYEVGFIEKLDLIHSCSVELPVRSFQDFQSALRTSSAKTKTYMDVPLHVNLILHRPLVKVDLAWDLGYYGEKIKIAVLDTGVDEEHPDLELTYSENVSEEADNRDLSGHGTHVAVIAAGRGRSGGYGLGIAPNAELISIKVLPGYTSNLIKGMEIAINKGAEVLNLSLGGPGEPWGPDGRAVHNAYLMGVLSVTSAGNGGPKFGTLTSPACNPSSIAVAAINRKFQITDYSSRGPPAGGHVKPDIAAPGGDHETPIISGRSKDMIDREFAFYLDYYFKNCGTSMAAPFVTGAAALVIQALRESGFDSSGKEWSETVKAILLSTAIKINASIWEAGSGVLNVLEAVKKAEKTEKPQKYEHPATPPPITPPTSCDPKEQIPNELVRSLIKIMEKYKLPPIYTPSTQITTNLTTKTTKTPVLTLMSEEVKNLIMAIKRGAGKKAIILLSRIYPTHQILNDLYILGKTVEKEKNILEEINKAQKIITSTRKISYEKT